MHRTDQCLLPWAAAPLIPYKRVIARFSSHQHAFAQIAQGWVTSQRGATRTVVLGHCG